MFAQMRFVGFVAAFLLVAIAPVTAEPLYNKPVYNPETKSYFELFATNPEAARTRLSGGTAQWKWRDAYRVAASRSYNGVRGRLAIVPSQSVHQFLRNTFEPNISAWIGLRYWCKFHKLQWVDGTLPESGAFAIWGPIWNQGTTSPDQSKDRAPCDSSLKSLHLGVHYWSTRDGFYWNANGYNKEFSAIFIEYPTGKP